MEKIQIYRNAHFRKLSKCYLYVTSDLVHSIFRWFESPFHWKETWWSFLLNNDNLLCSFYDSWSWMLYLACQRQEPPLIPSMLQHKLSFDNDEKYFYLLKRKHLESWWEATQEFQHGGKIRAKEILVNKRKRILAEENNFGWSFMLIGLSAFHSLNLY